jgi:hypothetical protein
LRDIFDNFGHIKVKGGQKEILLYKRGKIEKKQK